MDLRGLILIILPFTLAGCTAGHEIAGIHHVPPEEIAVFTSSDSILQKSYEWARKMALSYSHDSGDPVGPWYEAALPKREAFCMRDVAHQSVGAHILGLCEHNKNMLSIFADNISEGKDWCSFWEINRYNKPVPADYLNDREFWYNLNANFDMMQACLNLYEWTGDEDYVSAGNFVNFYDRTASDFVQRWKLTPDSVMTRAAHMNVPEDFDEGNCFHICRGLPSYVETEPGMHVGIDLLASMCKGYEAYSKIKMIGKDHVTAEKSAELSRRYRQIIDEEWWDENRSAYRTALMEDGRFSYGEGLTHLLWFEAVESHERIRKVVETLMDGEWNIENVSHFPMLFFRNGFLEEGYDNLVRLPAMNRSEFPEACYSFIEGCVCGGMGFYPSYSGRSVSSVCRLCGDGNDYNIRNVPVFDGYISLRHVGMLTTEISNDTGMDLTWDVSFIGDHQWIECGGRKYAVSKRSDPKGNILTSACIELPHGATLRASAGS